MSARDRSHEHVVVEADGPSLGSDLLRPLLAGDVPASSSPSRSAGVVVGELLALTVEEGLPLVVYPGQPDAGARVARAGVGLDAAHVGCSVVLAFERGDLALPIVVGVLPKAGWPLADAPAQVRVDVDGKHLVVSAKERLVLRCGKASITLTEAGKVLIEGTYVLSRSSGVNRVKGGSIHLN